MSVLFAAVLLCLPSVSLAQGNAFGGSSVGGGLGTCPTGDICQAANDLVLKTGNLIIETPGAGVIVTPQAAVGSGIVLSEMGNGVGNHALTLKLDDTDFPASLECTINSEGFWSGTGCRGFLGQSTFVWGSSTVTPSVASLLLGGIPFVIDNLETPALSSVPFYATTTASTLSSFVFKPYPNVGNPTIVKGTIFEGLALCGSLGACYIPLSPVVEATLGISDLDILTDTVNGVALKATLDGSTSYVNNSDKCSSSVFTGACAGGIILSDVDPTAGKTTWEVTVEATASTQIGPGGPPTGSCAVTIYVNGGLPNAIGLNLPMTASTQSATGLLVVPTNGGSMSLGLFNEGGACHNPASAAGNRWQGDITITVSTT